MAPESDPPVEPVPSAPVPPPLRDHVRVRVLRGPGTRPARSGGPAPEPEPPAEPAPAAETAGLDAEAGIRAEAEIDTVPMPVDEPSAAVPVSTDPILDDEPSARRSRAGTIGVGLVLVMAGLLFTTSAATAHGTQLRSDRTDLPDLLVAENARVAAQAKRVAALNDQVTRETKANTANNQAIAALEQRSAGVVDAAGLLPVSGPGLTVSLNDAPHGEPVPADIGPDDLVVHQQDVQAVVNALWAGGAEAMMLQDQRVISTSAVRCVGNTLILQGRVYSPPFTVTVIGDVAKLKAAMAASVQIDYYLQYVATLRLGWSVKTSDRIRMPAYSGSLALAHARVADPATTATPSPDGSPSDPATATAVPTAGTP